MPKFRKKPIEVEAVAAVRDFEVETLEGNMQVRRGDIIITGVNGEMYPCRLDIFLKTYDSVEEQCQQVIDLALKIASPEVLKAIDLDEGLGLVIHPEEGLKLVIPPK